jgi:hypothetical protein
MTTAISSATSVCCVDSVISTVKLPAFDSVFEQELGQTTISLLQQAQEYLSKPCMNMTKDIPPATMIKLVDCLCFVESKIDSDTIYEIVDSFEDVVELCFLVVLDYGIKMGALNTQDIFYYLKSDNPERSKVTAINIRHMLDSVFSTLSHQEV